MHRPSIARFLQRPPPPPQSAPRTSTSLQEEPTLTAPASRRCTQPSSPPWSTLTVRRSTLFSTDSVGKKVVHAAEAAVPIEGLQLHRRANQLPPAIHRPIPSATTTAFAPQTSTSLQVEPSLTTSAPRRRTQAAVAAMVDSHGEVIYPLLHRQCGEKGSARVVEVAVPI